MHLGQGIGQEAYDDILLSILPRTRESGDMGGRPERNIRSIADLRPGLFRDFAKLRGEFHAK